MQAVGRIPVDFHELGVATLAASAHKFHGPVGIGLLLVKSGVRLGSRLFGGGQQQGRRPGTVAVPLAVGLAAALQKWHDQVAVHGLHAGSALRDRLESGLIAALGPSASSATARLKTSCDSPRPSISASPASTATPS